jgi:hypothetical protein
MLTPTYSLTATERVLPRIALDFTTGVLDPRISLTRANDTATVINQSGTIVQALANTPRFDYNPSTLVSNGLLLEAARTNLLLNSLLNGTSLATQTVTVAATSHTLSFYGAGTVTLSGTHSATVAGAGAYPSRRTYTFTPTAGSLTLTVSGTVQFANLEAGAFATSFIPTDGTTKTRNAEVVLMTGTNFSDWYNATEGTFYFDGLRFDQSGFFGLMSINNGTTANETYCTQVASSARVYVGSTGAITCSGTWNTNTFGSLAFAYKANDCAASFEGNSVATDTSVTLPTVDRMRIGNRADGLNPLSGYVKKILYWPSRLTNAQIQAFSK